MLRLVRRQREESVHCKKVGRMKRNIIRLANSVASRGMSGIIGRVVCGWAGLRWAVWRSICRDVRVVQRVVESCIYLLSSSGMITNEMSMNLVIEFERVVAVHIGHDKG